MKRQGDRTQRKIANTEVAEETQRTRSRNFNLRSLRLLGVLRVNSFILACLRGAAAYHPFQCTMLFTSGRWAGLKSVPIV
jgi:hypothetical protein